MRHAVVAGLVLLCASPLAGAQTAPTPLADFTSLCEEEAGTGFNWKAGSWHETSFVEDKWIVRKKSDAKLSSGNGTFSTCHAGSRDEDFSSAEVGWVAGCYSVSKLGAPQNFGWCTEYSRRANPTSDWRVTQITCEKQIGTPDFSFVPNGPFQYANFHGVVELTPIDDYKDSLKISHGKCSVIQ